MSATWWIVLDPSRDRVVYTTRSCLGAFRIARRRVGEPGRMVRGDGPEVTIEGRRQSLTVVQVGSLAIQEVRARVRERVAIPVASDGAAEIIMLPGGGSFTWVPAGSFGPATVRSHP